MTVKAKELPSLEKLKKWFEYKDGHFYWIKSPVGSVRVGSRAGGIWTDQRTGRQIMQMGVEGKSYAAHRLVYVWHGYYLKKDEEIDHIDGNSLNNSIENLRSCSKKENQENRKSCNSNSKSGHIGVTFDKPKNKWRATICHNRKKIFLGCYINIEDAIAARKESEKKYFTHNHNE